jgi:hypothetical protein
VKTITKITGLLLLFTTLSFAQKFDINKLRVNGTFGLTWAKAKKDFNVEEDKSIRPNFALGANYPITFYGKDKNNGVRVGLVLGQDWAEFGSFFYGNFSEIKVSIPNAKVRVFPILNFDSKESILNYFYLDYGRGFSTFEETIFNADFNKPYDDVIKTSRNMSYFGGGVQFNGGFSANNSEKHWKFIFGADYGRYTWKNAGGTTSAIRTFNTTIGLGYHF